MRRPDRKRRVYTTTKRTSPGVTLVRTHARTVTVHDTEGGCAVRSRTAVRSQAVCGPSGALAHVAACVWSGAVWAGREQCTYRARWCPGALVVCVSVPRTAAGSSAPKSPVPQSTVWTLSVQRATAASAVPMVRTAGWRRRSSRPVRYSTSLPVDAVTAPPVTSRDCLVKVHLRCVLQNIVLRARDIRHQRDCKCERIASTAIEIYRKTTNICIIPVTMSWRKQFKQFI